MPPRVDDRWLWLGFGVFIFFAAKGIRYAITDVVRLTEIDPQQYEPKEKSEGPEDNISLENLKILSESPNPNIAATATSLVVNRFVRLPNVFHELSKDLNSKNERTRILAKQAVAFLKEWHEWHMPIAETIAEIDERDMVERNLDNLLPRGADDGFRTPGSNDDDEDGGLTALSHRLSDGVTGLGDGNRWTTDMVPSLRNPVAGWLNVPRERPSADEIESRRNRREAMVLHEGDGAVVEEDIIRPRND